MSETVHEIGTSVDALLGGAWLPGVIDRRPEHAFVFDAAGALQWGTVYLVRFPGSPRAWVPEGNLRRTGGPFCKTETSYGVEPPAPWRPTP